MKSYKYVIIVSGARWVYKVDIENRLCLCMLRNNIKQKTTKNNWVPYAKESLVGRRVSNNNFASEKQVFIELL